MNIYVLYGLLDSLHLQFLFHSNWPRSNYNAKLFIPAFVLTILCRMTGVEEDSERVCKTLMRSINASAKRDESIGPKIHSLADAYPRDDVTPKGEGGGNPERPHLARPLPRLCSNNQWTRL